MGGPYPNIIYGRYGDEKVSSSVQYNIELGQRMVLPDGRQFAYARCDTATALAVGEFSVMPAPTDADLVLSTTGTAAVGATTIVITLGATAGVAKDELIDGYIQSYKGGTTGYSYKVKSNNSAAASETTNVTLYPYDPLKAPMAGSVYITRSPFARVVARAAGTSALGIPAGVPANSVAAGNYFWIQRQGPASVVGADTLGLVGEPAVCNTVVAGALSQFVIAADTTVAPGDWPVGRFMVAPAASTDFAMVYLNLETMK